MSKLTPEDIKALDALTNAASLYQRYVELARIAEIPGAEDDAEPVTRISCQPVGFVIKPQKSHASME